MPHVRLVGFALSLKNTYMFRNIATLVLGDLDHTAAPSVDKLYGVLPEASGLENLSIGRIDRTDPLSSLETLVLMQLKKLHIYTAGNEAVEVFLQSIRAPSLLQLDVKLLCDRDWSALLKFGELVRPVVALRIYGVCDPDLDLVSASTIMPGVRMLDVTTADRALARCAVLKEFKWTKRTSQAGRQWVSTKGTKWYYSLYKRTFHPTFGIAMVFVIQYKATTLWTESLYACKNTN
ncbi:hypothetical protein B0H14DRAFT_2583142 [Mycena olivaceomarginata]|nr:hypothetical protein B0H14DRAFT_2583142 [Mycena olivaceomarginata]